MSNKRHHSPLDVDSHMGYLDRCNRFTEITGTNNALAMMYLQDRQWNLEKAVSDYYSQNTGHRKTESKSTLFIDLTEPADLFPENTQSLEYETPKVLTILSWNIDGLDSTNFRDRTLAVISCIRTEQPHVVCLQEVVPASLQLFHSLLENEYHIFSASDDQFTECIHYFVAILIKKHASLLVDMNSFSVTPFPSSTMGRQLVSVDLMLDISRWDDEESACSGSIPPTRLRFHTAHLESCPTGASERKNQLRTIWSKMNTLASASSAAGSRRPESIVFCGDLNLRDSEIAELGGVPTGIQDVWEATGSRPELRWTWDPIRNSNAGRHIHSITRKLKPKPCRFDRMYWSGARLRAVDFGLRGLGKLPRGISFPSDHWAILGRFVIR